MGIRLFVNSLPGFTGILKHRYAVACVHLLARLSQPAVAARRNFARPCAARRRYADFKVNEVDLQGRVVRLTSLEPPQVRGAAAAAAAAACCTLPPARSADAFAAHRQRATHHATPL